jgi:hypothetical protein
LLLILQTQKLLELGLLASTINVSLSPTKAPTGAPTSSVLKLRQRIRALKNKIMQEHSSTDDDAELNDAQLENFLEASLKEAIEERNRTSSYNTVFTPAPTVWKAVVWDSEVPTTAPTLSPTTRSTLANIIVADASTCTPPYTFIETVAECQAASASLSLADTTASIVNKTLDNGAPRPHGCYSKPSNVDTHPNYVLWFNFGGEKLINDPERLSICKLGPTRTPTPTPTAAIPTPAPGDPTAAPTALHLTLEEEVADTQENRIHSLQHLLEKRAEQHANTISPGAEKMVKNLMDCIIDHEDSEAIEAIQTACQTLLSNLFPMKYPKIANATSNTSATQASQDTGNGRYIYIDGHDTQLNTFAFALYSVELSTDYSQTKKDGNEPGGEVEGTGGGGCRGENGRGANGEC